EGNEDSYLIVEPLYAVADGMGGHRGGEVASSLALETVQGMFERREGSLAEQVAEANRAVFDRSQNDRRVSGMGTTLTAAEVDGNRVHLVHVGDSRAYLLHGGELMQITEDHTLVHRMVMEGEISEEEAETHPHRSILTRALGVDQNIQVDEGHLEVAPGDRLLLCTDGLTGMVPEGQIRGILLETLDPQEAVDKLVRGANRAGGIDNITAVILDFADDGGGPGATKRSAMPQQPTTERPSPPAARPERSDVTIVGAPISEPSPASSVTPSSRAPSRTDRPAPERRPEPPRPGSRRVGRKVGIWTGVTLAIVALGVVGLRVYLDTQWFVGVSNGRVAIFRGVPAEVAGLELHSVVVETSIPAERAEAIGFYRELPDGITADDRAGAEAIVESIREDVARFEQPTP
ncbi:MAG TPA: Stp1/IreP family PP2C-type Ser/Thr phosphatase, partial [Actinomycetota bacterium]|nr:Stp1/IreP family PP2C-type Ser/Thr phosphatase [Actinomycetota bacterium]